MVPYQPNETDHSEPRMRNVSVLFREAGQNFKMENFHHGSSGESQIPHIVPKRVAALRAEVEHNRANIQAQARRRLRDYKPSPLSLPPLRKRSSNMRISVHHRPPEFMASYPVLPPISRRKAQNEKNDYSNGNVTANNNMFASAYNRLNIPPQRNNAVPYTSKNPMQYKNIDLPPNLGSDTSYYTKNVLTSNKRQFTKHTSGQSAFTSNSQCPLHLKPRTEQPYIEYDPASKTTVDQKYFASIEPPLVSKVAACSNTSTPPSKYVNALLHTYANVQLPSNINNDEDATTNKDVLEQNRSGSFQAPNNLTGLYQQLDRCHSEKCKLQSFTNPVSGKCNPRSVEPSSDDNATQESVRKDEPSNTDFIGKYMYGNIPPSQIDKAVKYIYSGGLNAQYDNAMQYKCEDVEAVKTSNFVESDNGDMVLCKRFNSEQDKSQYNDLSKTVSSAQSHGEEVAQCHGRGVAHLQGEDVETVKETQCNDDLSEEPCHLDDVLTNINDSCKEQKQSKEP